MKQLVIKGSTSVDIVDGYIKSKNGFLLVEKGNKLIITSKPGITITAGGVIDSVVNIFRKGRNIQINGNSNYVSNSSITINGDKVMGDIIQGDKVVINGKTYIEDPDSKDDENLIKEFKLTSMINSISIQGSGDVNVIDKSMIDDNLSLTVQGSGDIEIYGKKEIKTLNCSVQGSGDITLYNLTIHTASLSVMGSGDITGNQCSCNCMSKNVMGSGDINGFN